jgi:hypothetical protein
MEVSQKERARIAAVQAELERRHALFVAWQDRQDALREGGRAAHSALTVGMGQAKACGDIW